MKKEFKNCAYIDGTNLHKGIGELGWKLDYKRFQIFLRDKYHVGKIYIFLGFISKNANLYRDLQNSGYTIIFKPTIPDGSGEIKGNCDGELILQAVCDFYENNYNKVILITGDGDFACLVKFLEEKKKQAVILSPSQKKCSILLKQTDTKITFLEELREKLEYKKRK